MIADAEPFIALPMFPPDIAGYGQSESEVAQSCVESHCCMYLGESRCLSPREESQEEQHRGRRGHSYDGLVGILSKQLVTQ